MALEPDLYGFRFPVPRLSGASGGAVLLLRGCSGDRPRVWPAGIDVARCIMKRLMF